MITNSGELSLYCYVKSRVSSTGQYGVLFKSIMKPENTVSNADLRALLFRSVSSELISLFRNTPDYLYTAQIIAVSHKDTPAPTLPPALRAARFR